jgi:hypothetical protein
MSATPRTSKGDNIFHGSRGIDMQACQLAAFGASPTRLAANQ